LKTSQRPPKPRTYVRETSLYTGAIPNQVRISQTSLFVSVSRWRSSREDIVELLLKSVMMAGGHVAIAQE